LYIHFLAGIYFLRIGAVAYELVLVGPELTATWIYTTHEQYAVRVGGAGLADCTYAYIMVTISILNQNKKMFEAERGSCTTKIGNIQSRCHAAACFIIAQ
jgi:hypothetical protein